MKKIITIDPEKCVGCGLCISACQGGAIALIDGKATLTKADYCDGLGNCLPVCPTKAISFTEKDASDNPPSVQKNTQDVHCDCPSTFLKTIDHANQSSLLTHWPIQIQLVPPNAPYLQNANLLIAADCTAFAHGPFHSYFIKNKIVLIGCPKLDQVDYSEKLTTIFTQNDIKSIIIARMEVPCCTGIVNATKQALLNSQKPIPWQIVTISIDGRIV
jgi:ferredoxin